MSDLIADHTPECINCILCEAASHMHYSIPMFCFLHSENNVAQCISQDLVEIRIPVSGTDVDEYYES